jgi:hypothetical protein
MTSRLSGHLRQIFPENFSITSPSPGNLLVRDTAIDRGRGYSINITEEAAYNEATIRLDDYAAGLSRHAERMLADHTHPVRHLFRESAGIYAKRYSRRVAGLFAPGTGQGDGWWLVIGQRKHSHYSDQTFADVLLSLILAIFPYDTGAEEEGATVAVFLTRYERSRVNRSLCLAFHGYDCKVCGVSLQEKYGDVARSFIHVHHLMPVAAAGQVIPDPVTDMIPLCPNCHGIAHLRNPPYTPEEIKSMLKQP